MTDNTIIMNGFIVKNVNETFYIYENFEKEAIKIAKNATEMIKWCNTH